MGTDGACGLLFCAAKRSGAFPPNMPAGLRARVGAALSSHSSSISTPGALIFFIPTETALLCLFSLRHSYCFDYIELMHS
jgi:hypothetical protein